MMFYKYMKYWFVNNEYNFNGNGKFNIMLEDLILKMFFNGFK